MEYSIRASKKFIPSFDGYLPSQRSASVNLDQVMEMLNYGGAASSVRFLASENACRKKNL
jgi:hypothetical protein